MGTLRLLQAVKLYWGNNFNLNNQSYGRKLFYHISTDEAYGTLEFDNTLFKETTKYDPHSPYSGSKASIDHFVRAYHNTYSIPVIVTNRSNNYGQYQFPENLFLYL